jgi:hypothetical protein
MGILSANERDLMIVLALRQISCIERKKDGGDYHNQHDYSS